VETSSPTPRLFLTLTLAEASALLRRPERASEDRDRRTALAKIQYAVQGATPPPVVKQSGQFDGLSISSNPHPPLRAHDYATAQRPCKPIPRAGAHMTKAAIRTPSTPEPDDAYVPWRDEAGGAYK
jgi:hypothetical protein